MEAEQNKINESKSEAINLLQTLSNACNVDFENQELAVMLIEESFKSQLKETKAAMMDNQLEIEKKLHDCQSQLKEERESLKIINTVMINKDYEGARKLLESIIYSNLKTK